MLRKKSVGGLLPVLMGLALIAAPLVLTGCPGGSDPVRVTGVAIYQEVADADNLPVTDGTISLSPGGTVQLREVVTPANANNRAVDWESAYDTIATISADGLVTAVAVGSTVITVTSRDVRTVYAQVTVMVADAALVSARNELQAAITANTGANAPAEAVYTPESLAIFTAALTAAQAALADAASTVAQLNAARTALINARVNLVPVAGVDPNDPAIVTARNALQTLITTANARGPASAYTPETWGPFAAARTAAIAAAADMALTAAQLDAAHLALYNAMNALYEAAVDPALAAAREALAEVIEEAEELDEDLYTDYDGTWEAFEEALADAIAALVDAESTVAQLNEAREALEETMTALVSVARYNARADLQTVVTAAAGREEANYTPETWGLFYAARTAAQTSLTNWRTQTLVQLNNARTNLYNAMNALETPLAAVRIALAALIAEANTFDAADFTPATWAVFYAALGEAEEVYANNDATLSELNEALEALQEAMEELVPYGNLVDGSLTIAFEALSSPLVGAVEITGSLSFADEIEVENPDGALVNIRWYRGTTLVPTGAGGTLVLDSSWEGSHLLTVRAEGYESGRIYSLAVRFTVAP